MAHSGGDTIVARATARGVGAIAMVRLSGPDARRIAARCFSGKNLSEVDSHTAHVGMARSEDAGDLDQVVATVFLAPGTATGEDVVELTCHGGELIVRTLLDALVAAGARPAEPGEFTQRAFLNGRIDLAQAEAVAELIHAGSRRAQHVSLNHLKGSYSALLSALRHELMDLCAFIELELDFTEEDVAFADRGRLETLLERCEELLTRLVSSYRYGAMLRDGLTVVIGGRPNAGKSTLLNALLGYERAIVSETPGTTRDEIGEEMEFEGLRLHFVDTAGLRETMDEIEAEGVRRAEASIRTADALVYVYDVTAGLDEEEHEFLRELEASHPDLFVFVVANKYDLVAADPDPDPDPDPDAVADESDPVEAGADSGVDIVNREGVRSPFRLSARHAMQDEDRVRPLLEAIVSLARSSEAFNEESDVVTNERHVFHLKKALDSISDARRTMRDGATSDLLAQDLRVALHELGAITGETTTEDILDRIFSRFCIGK